MTHAVGPGPAPGPVTKRPGVFIFDLDGVIYRGDSVLPFAADAITTLQDAGAAVFFLTNNSSRTRESYARKLAAMGVATQPDQIITSGYATALILRDQGLAGGTAYVVGEEGLVEELTRAGIRVAPEVGSGRVDAVVVGLDRAFTYEKILQAQQAIRAGARFLATNGDKTFPIEGGQIIPGAGAMVAAVEAAGGVPPTVIGKPEPHAFRIILDLADATPEQTTVVGDRLDTDILAGRRLGLRTVLVLTGIATREDVAAAPEEMRPDCVIPDLSHVAELL